jgi:hypothetical protein
LFGMRVKSVIWVFMILYRDKKVVGVFVRFSCAASTIDLGVSIQVLFFTNKFKSSDTLELYSYALV